MNYDSHASKCVDQIHLGYTISMYSWVRGVKDLVQCITVHLLTLNLAARYLLIKITYSNLLEAY